MKSTEHTEVVFGRPKAAKVFVSSEMRSGELAEARMAVRDAIEETGWHASWTWEHDGEAGPFCSAGVCIGHASTSDFLILILGRTLTDITRGEYFAAKKRGAFTVVFLPTDAERDEAAEGFYQTEAKAGSYGKYSSMAELRARVIGSLQSIHMRVMREAQVDRRASMGGVSGVIAGDGGAA